MLEMEDYLFGMPYPLNLRQRITIENNIQDIFATGIEKKTQKPSFSVVSKAILSKCDRYVFTHGDSCLSLLFRSSFIFPFRFFYQLQTRKMIREISLDEMLSCIHEQQLTPEQLTLILKWYSKPQVEQALFSGKNHVVNTLKFLSAINVRVTEGTDNETSPIVIQNLGEVDFFVTSKAMKNLPLPPSTISPLVSNLINKTTMLKKFGWKELTVGNWWLFLKDNMHLLLEKQYNLELLKYISEFYPMLEEAKKKDVVTTLGNFPCIPIEPKHGDQQKEASEGLCLLSSVYLDYPLSHSFSLITLHTLSPASASQGLYCSGAQQKHIFHK